MNDGENPDGVSVYLINQSVTAVRRKFARSGHFAFVPQHREIGKSGNGLAEQVINSDGGGAIALQEIVPNIGAVLARLRRSENFHP